MFQLEVGRSLKSLLGFSCALVFLLRTHKTEAQSQVIGPPQPMVALVGGDIILPCHLKPAVDAVLLTVEWTRPDLEPRFVHLRRGEQDLLDNQNLQYEERTSLSISRLRHGDISLKLYRVRQEDAGIYRCFIPEFNKDAFFQLSVGSTSSPLIVSIDRPSGGGGSVELQCESAGWYPEPEVLWLDGEGNLLPAGPTETLRGPDDLYTVSSRVTVDKRHSNKFTCRVQQHNINQTSETQFQVSAVCFSAPSCSAGCVSAIWIVLIICVCAAAFTVWKWRQNQTKESTRQLEGGATEKQKLMEEEELQKKEEELRELEELIQKLLQQEEAQSDKILKMHEMIEGGRRDIEEKLKKVEDSENTDSDRKKGYVELKRIIGEARNKMVGMKEDLEDLQRKTEEVMHTAKDGSDQMINRKDRLRSRLTEIQKQRGEVQEKLQSKQEQKTSPV